MNKIKVFDHISRRMVHTKCRNNVYPFSKVHRITVGDEQVPWTSSWDSYDPPEYNSEVLRNKPWADPSLESENFQPQWNKLDGSINRKSHMGDYAIVSGRPLNPEGRTGIKGRGVLGKWGPNHAADPIVTRWKSVDGEKLLNPSTNLPILQFCSIQRRDCKQWALPGGMVDHGEKISETLQREFLEEALNSLEASEKQREDDGKIIRMFFSSGRTVYEAIICGAASLLMRSERRWWVRPWLKEKKRGNLYMMKEELGDDPESFKNFIRMDEPTFENLLERVELLIRKQNTSFRDSIPARDRLIITLRYLATGESMRSLNYSFRVGHSTISEMIPEVCDAIYNCLKDEFLKAPNKTEDWITVAEDFMQNWQFPNALGAIDGKHIVFQAPANSGSTFFNYKGTHSVVLLALVDANYKFLYVDVGINGRISDGGVFRRSPLFRAMAKNQLNFPEPISLPGKNKPLPYCIIGDAAFPLMRNVMKPFPFRNMSWEKRIFNYRLSRARRVVENAFGILTNRWRILLTTINLSSDKVVKVTLACVALHNYLYENCPSTYSIPDENLDATQTFLNPIRQQQGNRAGSESIANRNEYMEYFITNGAIPGQSDRA